MLTDTDVQTAETTTAPDSSTEDQTTTEQAASEESKATATETAKTDAVPEANRWAERARKAEKELAALQAAREADQPQRQADPNQEAIKAQLKAMGFVSKTEIDAELARREQDARVEQELGKLESKYAGTDGRPKFERDAVLDFAIKNGIASVEVAYKALHEKELMDWAIAQAITKTQGVKSEGSDGSGSSQVGTTTEDLKEAIKSGDKGALRTYLKRLM